MTSGKSTWNKLNSSLYPSAQVNVLAPPYLCRKAIMHYFFRRIQGVIIRKELLLPILCGIYLVESLTVIIQRVYCKYYRKKYHLAANESVPVAKRPFLMTPLHHHYQQKGYHESKIVQRFIIVGILLAVLTIVTLKLR